MIDCMQRKSSPINPLRTLLIQFIYFRISSLKLHFHLCLSFPRNTRFKCSGRWWRIKELKFWVALVGLKFVPEVFGEVCADCEMCSYSSWSARNPFFLAVGTGYDWI